MRQAKGRRNGGTFSFRKAAAGLAMLAAVSACAYFGTACYYQSHFLPRVVLCGIPAGGRPVEEARRLLEEKIKNYRLVIKGRDGKKETVKGSDISLKAELKTDISELVKRQNTLFWPAGFLFPQEIKEELLVSFDREALKKKVRQLSFLKKENQKPPENARCSGYGKDGYRIIPEKPGSSVNGARLSAALEEAVGSLKPEISLDKEGCYESPKVTRNNLTLIKICETLNRYVKTVITYEAGSRKEVLDAGKIHTWLSENGMQAVIDEEAAQEYANGLAATFNTAFRKHELKTSYGTTVEITDGDYGWKVDKEREKEQILRDIRAGRAVTREPAYSQRAASHGKNDYGDTYVEISLSAQRLFFYKDGVLLTESDLVSGNTSRNYDTPTGIYALTYKERNAVLRGENYATPVSYWMPFCNNVGMHDASWRSRFGGSIYKTGGSHGCVNLPAGAARQIFEQIQEGDPVLVY